MPGGQKSIPHEKANIDAASVPFRVLLVFSWVSTTHYHIGYAPSFPSMSFFVPRIPWQIVTVNTCNKLGNKCASFTHHLCLLVTCTFIIFIIIYWSCKMPGKRVPTSVSKRQQSRGKRNSHPTNQLYLLTEAHVNVCRRSYGCGYIISLPRKKKVPEWCPRNIKVPARSLRRPGNVKRPLDAKRTKKGDKRKKTSFGEMTTSNLPGSKREKYDIYNYVCALRRICATYFTGTYLGNQRCDPRWYD